MGILASMAVRLLPRPWCMRWTSCGPLTINIAWMPIFLPNPPTNSRISWAGPARSHTRGVGSKGWGGRKYGSSEKTTTILGRIGALTEKAITRWRAARQDHDQDQT